MVMPEPAARRVGSVVTARRTATPSPCQLWRHAIGFVVLIAQGFVEDD